MTKILNKVKEEIVEINGKILNIDDILKEVLKKVKIKNKKDFKTFEKFGFEAASTLLIKAGSTTKDDDIIIGVLAAAIVAGALGMSGGAGTLASSYVTTATVTPILKGAFKAINAFQLKEGEKLAQMAKDIQTNP